MSLGAGLHSYAFEFTLGLMRIAADVNIIGMNFILQPSYFLSALLLSYLWRSFYCYLSKCSWLLDNLRGLLDGRTLIDMRLH